MARDKRLYKPSDAATAKRLARAALQELGAAATKEQGEWSILQDRAWKLLLTTYDEVRRGGLFLYTKDRADERFPSLIGTCRSPSSRAAREAKEDSAAAPAEPAPVEGAAPA